ncbi:MAG: DoxX family membrane protein [Flavobacteriaceae bacterium]|nr:MAG: DoxX family membrane protein [Flavobacteriaceae bacterium]
MKKYFPLALKLIAAIIMLQTLFFKFTNAQESIDLFTKIAGEKEALMRIGTGIIELIAFILLFIPKKTWLGALLTFGTMSGAIISHLTIIGIVHNNDSGALFISAMVAFMASGMLLIQYKRDIPFIGSRV